jgi:hypothetical protein
MVETSNHSIEKGAPVENNSKQEDAADAEGKFP